MLKSLLAGKRRQPTAPRCLWAGEHSGEPICYVIVERDCGHFDRDNPTCLNHVQVLLGTGGVAERPSPCYRQDCDFVGIARVAHTKDIPGRLQPQYR